MATVSAPRAMPSWFTLSEEKDPSRILDELFLDPDPAVAQTASQLRHDVRALRKFYRRYLWRRQKQSRFPILDF